jgi:hypothetical protein
MLAYRLIDTSPKEWFGRPLEEIHDGDLWRYWACKKAAQRVMNHLNQEA